MIRKIILLLLMLVLVSCSYQTSFASEIDKLLHLTDPDRAVSFTVNSEIVKIPQFDQVRTEQLNALLRHLSLKGGIQYGLSFVSAILDGNTLFTITVSDETGFGLVLPEDPDHTYSFPVAETDLPVDFPYHPDDYTFLTRNTALYRLLDHLSVILSHLPDAFPDESTSSKIRETYRNYGTAVLKTIVKISGEELNSYLSPADIAGLFPNLTDSNYVPAFSGKQGFTLYFDEENQLIKVSYSGRIVFPENDSRSIRLEWKTVRKDEYRKDELTLRTPNENATKRNNIILDSLWQITENGESFHWKAETDQLKDRIRSQGITSIDMKADTEGISCKIDDSMTVIGKKKTKEIEIQSSVPHNGIWNGTLEIIDKKDKILVDSLKTAFQISDDKSAWESFSFPANSIPLSEEDSGIILDSVYDSIIRALMLLPNNDLVFLTEGLPEI